MRSNGVINGRGPSRQGTADPSALRTLGLLKATLNSLPVAVVLVDQDMRYIMANEQAALSNGLTAASHIGRRAADVVPDAFSFVEPFFREVFRTGNSIKQPPFQAETPAMAGAKRWWEVQYEPVLEDENTVAVSATFSDITDRVEAEATLKATMQELRTILDVLPVGLAIAHDQECLDVELNPAYRRLLKVPEDVTFSEWANRQPHSKFMLEGREVEREELPLRKAAATGETTVAGRLDILRPDGNLVNVLARAAPMFLDGIARGAVAAYMDVTDLVRIQDQLRTANRVQYDFLAMVSHELRTPLTMILGNAQLLSRGEGTFTDEERSILAADVYREAVNLSHIVDNLLLMTRIDKGEHLEREPVVLRHICTRVIGSFDFENERCRCFCPVDIALVMANPTSVEQVIRNLVSNALKYSPESEAVDINLEVRNHEVVLSVADRGPGIDSGDRERIFEPFFRAESTATRSGMGIGLAVCKRLMEAMSGRIWADARAGGGSVFSMALPMLETTEF